jgi:hypothetical protein
MLAGDGIISANITNPYFWFLFFVAIVCICASIILFILCLLNERKGKGPVLEFKTIGKERFKNER